MKFKALYFTDTLDIINPYGHIGLVTLWSKRAYIRSLLEKEGVDLSSETSPVAVIGNLYGNGLRHLIRNLLYNPQITELFIFGQDLSGSGDDLYNFFYEGVEDFSENGHIYRKIKERKRIIDTDIAPEDFEAPPKVTFCGKPSDKKSVNKLADVLHEHRNRKTSVTGKRKNIPLREVPVNVVPSDPLSHCVAAETPLEAWREVVYRLYRFGIPVELSKGKRKELLNVKVVIHHPAEEAAELLEKNGFSLEQFKRYQEHILSEEKPVDLAYRYGNRIRSAFGVDFLDIAVERLQKNMQDRHCYFSLWDSSKDVLKGLREGGSESAPCLISLFFRVFQGKLCLTACFRTHNGMDAWLENLYGLMALQDYVCRKLPSVEKGGITVISHSLSLSHDDLERAGRIANTRHFSFSHDVNGQIMVRVEGDEIILTHSTPEGLLIKEYHSGNAEKIQHDLVRDMAIANINHALYVGKLLAVAEQAIKEGRPELLDGL